jgi:hypothetical protein
MLIYEKQFITEPGNQPNPFDYLKINLLFPDLCKNRRERDELDELQLVTRISFETIIEYVNHRIFKSFKFRILGFGFSVIRQIGY